MGRAGNTGNVLNPIGSKLRNLIHLFPFDQHFITRKSAFLRSPHPFLILRIVLLDRAKHGSLDVLEHILSHEDCDVDPINRLGETPLHLAISSTEIDEDDGGLREEVVESLLDAGADVTYVTMGFLFQFHFCLH